MIIIYETHAHRLLAATSTALAGKDSTSINIYPDPVPVFNF
jgi:hypothetical protein